MPILSIPQYPLLERLFAVVAAQDGALLPGCRWLVLGPRLGAIVAPDEAPTLDQLTALLRLLRREAPDLKTVGEVLARNSEHMEDACVEVCIDRLLEASDWRHPTQVLDRPRPDFRKLLEACRARRKGTPASRRAKLEAVIERMEVAVDVEENARARRERMGRRRRR